MSGLLEHDELGSGDLGMEALRHFGGGEPILASPQNQSGQPETSQRAVVRRQLVGVARAVQINLSQAVAVVGERLPILVDRVFTDADRKALHGLLEPIARIGADESLSFLGSTHRGSDLVPGAVCEEAAVRDDQRPR
jgi:hypothetical protein